MKRKAIMIGFLLTILPTLLLAESGPRITFKQLEHDLGNVNHGEKGSTEFSFSNTGSETLVIKQLKSSCGCAKAVKGSKSVAPGGSSTIEAKIDTYGMSPGRHSKSIFVYTNDLYRPKTTLRLTFNVVRHVTLSPSYLTKVLSNAENEVIFPVIAINHWDRPISLQVPRSDCSECQPTLVPQKVIVPPGAKIDFAIRIPIGPKRGKKYVKGTATFETNDPIDKILQVRYFIRLISKGGA